ncbi:SRPBCC domain-containing protein, partial [Bradyrhizobium elkanii]
VWLPPAGMTGRIDHFDARPGGNYRMTLTYAGDHANAGKASADTDIVEGRFAELVENKRVAQIVSLESDDPSYVGNMWMIWKLTPVPAGTEVSIIAENVPPGISEEDHKIGMRSTLENLARFVE